MKFLLISLSLFTRSRRNMMNMTEKYEEYDWERNVMKDIWYFQQSSSIYTSRFLQKWFVLHGVSTTFMSYNFVVFLPLPHFTVCHIRAIPSALLWRQLQLTLCKKISMTGEYAEIYSVLSIVCFIHSCYGSLFAKMIRTVWGISH